MLHNVVCAFCKKPFETFSQEKRENFSRAAIKRILGGVSGYKTGHLTGIYESKKSTNPIRFKSSWELIAILWFEQDDKIISFEYEPMIVMLSTGRRTIPDFKVKYLDGNEEIIEIKPTVIQQLPEVAKKLELTQVVLSSLGLKYVILGNLEIEKMKYELGEKFENVSKLYKNRI